MGWDRGWVSEASFEGNGRKKGRGLTPGTQKGGAVPHIAAAEPQSKKTTRNLLKLHKNSGLSVASIGRGQYHSGLMTNSNIRSTACAASLLMLLVSTASFAQSAFGKEIDAWQQGRVAELKKDDGWLTLAGLFWLKEGVNTLGSNRSNNIELPQPAPERTGEVTLNRGKVSLALAEKVPATVQGKPVGAMELLPDTNEHPTIVRLGSLSIALIKRGDRFAIRVKNNDSELRRGFHGLDWFPANESYRINADFEAYETEKEVAVPNVLGDTYKMKSPGLIRFKFMGVEQTLEPVMEDEKLFIIFRDMTTGKTTYGAGRFLYADAPVNGKVILDFNKAFNPPCAFTPFATCPLPPKQNRLQVSIEAGEKDYHKTKVSK